MDFSSHAERDGTRLHGRAKGAARFMLGPSALIGAMGLLRGADATVPTPAEDWRRATVDLVIHVQRHQATIVHCLAGLRAQTRQPRRIVLVDDGGIDRDGSLVLAREFAAVNAMAIEVIARRWSIGRTPTLKRQASECDGDVLVVLDADTVLESPEFLERCVRELFQGAGIASVCGTVLPLRGRDRRAMAATAAFRRWLGPDAYRDLNASRDRAARIEQWLIDGYRQCVGLVQQRFVHRGQMLAFGGIAHPVGAVAYRRGYLKDLFDRYEPVHGEDDQTHAEDIFIGVAFGNEGYRNVQLADVVARVQQPARIEHLPARRARYTQAFLRGCYFFDALLQSPLKAPRRAWRRLRRPAPKVEQRRVREAYRQPFGERLTREQGRPIGWALAFTALEKILLPLIVLVLLATGQWRALAIGVLAELALWLALLAAVAPAPRAATLARGLLAAPLRYVELAADLVGVLRFGRELRGRQADRARRRMR
ncbi:glycosyltransferase [Lysobacter koreensis]|uniref:Glycosyltransferase n=1 Tax=Lysobacter koreensis TaxID=266122 RepID=A0ABW2YQQ1_9GAMM